MSPRPARRRRFPRALLLALLLLLLLPLAPVDWRGVLRFFRGGEAEGPGGGAANPAPHPEEVPAPRFDWSAVRERLAAAARSGQRAADEAELGETWRALADAVEQALAARDVGGARRALASARASWLSDASGCAAAAAALSAELEASARAARESELARLGAALERGEGDEARAGALALLATGDGEAFADACRIAAAARGEEAPLDGAARASEQAVLWRRATAGLPSEALLRALLALVPRAEPPTEAVAAARLAHELTRCAYPARRVWEDLESGGAEIRWPASREPAALRARGGTCEIRVPGEERYQPLRALDELQLVHAAVELFSPLGLDAADARTALALLLARSGEREAALRLLAAPPPHEDEERVRLLFALGS